MDSRLAGPPRPFVCGTSGRYGRTASESGPAAQLSSRRRPGAARELHGQCHCQRSLVRSDETETSPKFSAVASVHLLQRTHDRRHCQQRLRGADPRRHQEYWAAGRLPRGIMALRHCEVYEKADGQVFSRGQQAPGNFISERCSVGRPDERLPRVRLPDRHRFYGLREFRVAVRRQVGHCSDARLWRKGRGRPLRAGRRLR